MTSNTTATTPIYAGPISTPEDIQLVRTLWVEAVDARRAVLELFFAPSHVRNGIILKAHQKVWGAVAALFAVTRSAMPSAEAVSVGLSLVVSPAEADELNQLVKKVEDIAERLPKVPPVANPEPMWILFFQLVDAMRAEQPLNTEATAAQLADFHPDCNAEWWTLRARTYLTLTDIPQGARL